jgi:hypothetical protein
MSALNLNDVFMLKIGDKISYKDVSYTIADKSYDQDYGGMQYTFTLKNDNNKTKELTINNRGDTKGSFPDSTLSENGIMKISGGGRRKRKHKTKRNSRRHRKSRTKKTRKYYK